MSDSATRTKPPRIEVLRTPECPHADGAERRVREVAARLSPTSGIEVVRVETAAEAERHAFPGSPTVRVDGRDVEGAEAGRPSALACRTYDGSGEPPPWMLEAALLRALRPRHLLFLCVANSARSQIAEGVARSMAPPGVRVSSAGSEPVSVRAEAVAVLEEIGIDAAGQRSKGMDEVGEDGDPVDVVVTLCAEEVCPAWLGEARRVHWPLPDPAGAGGDEEEVTRAFREVREELVRRVAALFGTSGPWARTESGE